jgi:hypothetical protein
VSPALAWLISEMVKLTVQHVSEIGKFNTLTEEEAKQMSNSITESLEINLPTPEQLENPSVKPL